MTNKFSKPHDSGEWKANRTTIKKREILYKTLSYAIIGAAMEVHKKLGPGFLEKVYENALVHELKLRNISFTQQQHLPVYYKGVAVGHYVADIIIDNKIILELKATTELTGKHKAQTVHYLAATGHQLAILINFGEKSLKSERFIRKTYK